MLSPDIAKKLVSLDISVPWNCEPSDIVTLAVAITVPAGVLSGIVGLAGDRVIVVGVATTTNGAVASKLDVETPSSA